MKIFFANIGNRNLRWQGEYPDTNSFKEVTEIWEQEFEHRKNEFGLQIIPGLIQEFGPYDRIVLVGTNTNHHQDTIHSARIIQGLLPEKIPGLKPEQLELMQLKDSITNDEAVFNFYKGLISSSIRQSAGELEVHVCDAGGTPQQKLAMKIMADFMLEPEQLKVLYINQQNQASEVNLTSYRNLFTGLALLRLIETGSYRAALVLRNREGYLHGQGGKNKADKLIRLGHYLVNNQWPPELKKDWSNYFPKEQPLIESLFNEVPCLAINPLPGSNSAWFVCAQNYYLARFFLQQNEFSRAVMCFAYFYEKLFNDLARAYLGWEDRKKSRKDFESSLEEKVNQEFSDHFKPFKSGIPHLCRLALLITNGKVREAILAIREHLVELELVWNEEEKKWEEQPVYKPQQPLLLDVLRNAIAHEGKTLTRKEEEELKKGMGDLLGRIGELLGWNGIEQIPELNKQIELFIKENPN